MKKSTDVSAIFKPVGGFFQRFHLTVFIVVLVGGLSYAVVSLYDVLSQASVVPETSTATTGASNAALDQSTIDRITQLHDSASALAVTLPTGRINPFGE